MPGRQASGARCRRSSSICTTTTIPAFAPLRWRCWPRENIPTRWITSPALHDVELPSAWRRSAGWASWTTSRPAPLVELLKDRAELVRAEAVAAIAVHGPETTVLAAAADPSWRVRMKVAAALAEYPDAAGSTAARRMLSDPRRGGRAASRAVTRVVAAGGGRARAVGRLGPRHGKRAEAGRRSARGAMAGEWAVPLRGPARPPGRSPGGFARAMPPRDCPLWPSKALLVPA